VPCASDMAYGCWGGEAGRRRRTGCVGAGEFVGRAMQDAPGPSFGLDPIKRSKLVEKKGRGLPGARRRAGSSSVAWYRAMPAATGRPIGIFSARTSVALAHIGYAPPWIRL
jgi:hypothetical protein